MNFSNGEEPGLRDVCGSKIEINCGKILSDRLYIFPSTLTLLIFIVFIVTGCSTVRKTLPPRTATEQLLISAAVDRAIERLSFSVPVGAKIWLDTRNFTGYDAQYAISAIKEYLLRQGGQLVNEGGMADFIVEIRAGALSIDENERFLGIPSFSFPIPLTGDFKFPELALFRRNVLQGIAKFALFGYDAKSGALYSFSGPVYGASNYTQWRVLLLGWTTSNMIPKNALK